MGSYWQDKRVVVTGGAGFIGSAVCRLLEEQCCGQILVPRSSQFDLTRAEAVQRMYDEFAPEIVLHLAGTGVGVAAHRANPAGNFYANLAMGMHLVEAGRRHRVQRFLAVGSADSYPASASSPLREEQLWDGLPAEPQAPYGIAKRAVGAMLKSYHQQYGFRSAWVILTNVYGPGANFDPDTSHVVAALVRRCCEAVKNGQRTMECWGTGSATRDFLYVEDAAAGILLAAERLDDPAPVNLGSGREVSIRELACTIACLAGFEGNIFWNADKPEGQSRRCLDTRRAREVLGFEASTSLKDGLRRTVEYWTGLD